MKNPIKVKEAIIEQLSLAEVMLAYGVVFAYDPRQVTEVQFHCPFHGEDNKPSARLYNTTKSCFCWVCRRAWDVISFIMEKEKMPFTKALIYISNRFKIDLSAIPDKPIIEFKSSGYSMKNVVLNNIRSHIIEMRRKIPFEKYRALCASFFMIKNLEDTEVLDNEKLIEDKILWLKSTL